MCKATSRYWVLQQNSLSYYEIDNIKYFRSSDTNYGNTLYRTGLQQGQVLDALYCTLNFSKRFNVSLSYKGIAFIRSLQTDL